MLAMCFWTLLSSPANAAGNALGHVCLYASLSFSVLLSNSCSNFWKPALAVKTSFFLSRYIIDFVCQGHRVKVKVTGTKCHTIETKYTYWQMVDLWLKGNLVLGLYLSGCFYMYNESLTTWRLQCFVLIWWPQNEWKAFNWHTIVYTNT